ncbi:MAG: site-2 protease family protein, partial [Myxococcota bacterium]
ALAGPAVNFVLAGIAGWGWLATHHPLVLSLVLGNLMMGLFNLIPAFPMDGGRVLRSLLARWMGWESASRLSIKIGRVFAWLFVGVGLWSLTASYNPSLLLVGAFLHVALNAEKAQLVAAFWEKTTGNPAWWDRGDGSKPAGLVVP